MLAARLVFVFCLNLAPQLLLSQPQPSDWESMFQRNELAAARKMLGNLMKQEPQLVLDHIGDVEFILLEHGARDGQEVARKPQTDTLIRLYDLGISSRPHQKASWMARKAMLAARFPHHYPHQALSFIEEAIGAAPLECPLHLYALWLEEVIRKTPDRTDAHAGMWFKLDRSLYLRSVFCPDESEECTRLEQSLSRRMVATLPPCISLQSSWMATLSSQLTEEKAMSFLAASHLVGCEDSASWKKAVQFLSFKGILRADFARIQAMEAMERHQDSLAFAFWQQAIALEKDAEVIAGDLLFLAEIKKAESEFTEAREYYQQAIAHLPSWGEPYLRLADLYRDGASQCRLNEFDQKAVYWVMIDLCRKAAEADPSYEAEVRYRIALYMDRMPTENELRLRYLKAGDTWPLRCWMSTAAIVKSR